MTPFPIRRGNEFHPPTENPFFAFLQNAFDTEESRWLRSEHVTRQLFVMKVQEMAWRVADALEAVGSAS